MVVVDPFNQARSKAFFVSKQVPLAVDALNRVLHQIKFRVGIREIYLSLPDKLPATNKTGVITDLARLNWFNGVIFASQADVSEVSKLVDVIRKFRSQLKVGIRDAAVSGYDFNFVLSTLEINVLSSCAKRTCK